MADLGQSIGLVHKLGKLAAAEEFLHRRHNGTDIDQCVGSGLPGLLNAHTLFHHAFHAQQANAELRLDQLAHAAHTTIAQVVNVILTSTSIVEHYQAAHNIHQIILRQNALALRNSKVELAVQFIAANTPQIITARVKEQ